MLTRARRWLATPRGTALTVFLWAALLLGASITHTQNLLFSPNVVNGCVSWAGDTFLCRDAANTPAWRNGTNAQTLRIYNTFTDASNNELVTLGAVSNEFVLRASKNGGGTNRNLVFGVSGSNQWYLEAATGNLLAYTDNAVDLGSSPTAGRPRSGYIAQGWHVGGSIHAGSSFVLDAHVVVIASEGTGAANNETLAGDRSLYFLDCNDANGCAITLSENYATVGQILRLVNIGANNITLADSGAHHLAGAFTGTPSATISLIRAVNRSGDGNWYELTRSVN